MLEIYKSQLEETKKSIKDVEKNIKRITGRDADEYALTATGNLKLKSDGKFSGNNPSFQYRKRTFPNRFGKPSAGKQEIWGRGEDDDVVTDESPDEDEKPVKKPSLQSTIVVTKKSVKSRKAAMEEQKSDSRGLARNRRIFGFVRGTLEKFREEESQHKAVVEKRAKIDKKLEEAAAKEKEKMEEEKKQMFIIRREKQAQMRCLEKKMEIAEMHEVWEKSNKLLTNFIQTKTQPVIMFAPKKHNEKSRKMLTESQKKVRDTIKAQKAKIDQELRNLDQLYIKDDKKDPMENEKEKSKCDDVPSESQNVEVQSNMEVVEDVVLLDSTKHVLEKSTLTNSPVPNTKEKIEVKSVKESGVEEDFEPIYDE